MVQVLAFVLALQAAPPGERPANPAADMAPRVGAPRADHRIGAEDVLGVNVFGHDDLVHTVRVDADGTFVFPLVGRVSALGLTAREVEAELARRLADGFVRDPIVSITVQSGRSQSVYALGEIARPGAYPLTDARTLVELLARAGPMLAAAGGEVIVLRGAGASSSSAPEVVRVLLRDLQSGAAEGNVALRADDTVLVPRAAQVVVTGAVRKPGAYTAPPGTTVRQAIGLAGGFTGRGTPGRVRIVRPDGAGTKHVTAGVDELVRADDTVVVER